MIFLIINLANFVYLLVDPGFYPSYLKFLWSIAVRCPPPHTPSDGRPWQTQRTKPCARLSIRWSMTQSVRISVRWRSNWWIGTGRYLWARGNRTQVRSTWPSEGQCRRHSSVASPRRHGNTTPH